MSTKIEVSDMIDRAFVFELATRGSVHVLSQQVSVAGESVDLSGIEIPAGVSIDWIGARATKDEWRPVASITFRFNGPRMPPPRPCPEVLDSND